MFKGKLICLVGISGSGKTTRRNDIVKFLGAEDVHVISRDELRESLFGYTPDTISEYYKRDDLYPCESFITRFSETIIKRTSKSNIIIDNTNLSQKYLKVFQKLAEQTNREFFVSTCEVNLETCIGRDSKRDRIVGEEIINKQHAQFSNLITSDYWENLNEFQFDIEFYCQSHIEGGLGCLSQCEHCKKYYKTLNND